MFVVALLLAAQPLALGRAGPVGQITRAHHRLVAGGQAFVVPRDYWQTYSLFGLEADLSIIDLVARPSGRLRIGDLVGVTLLGGNEHDLDPVYGPNNLLTGGVEARGGAQAVFAVNGHVDLGADAGACACSYPDEPRTDFFTWFAHARLRYDWAGVEGGYDHGGPMAGAFALLGPLRASISLQRATFTDTPLSAYFTGDREWWMGRFALHWQFR